MNGTLLALRVGGSLVLVLALVWFLSRQARRRGLGGTVDGERFTVIGRASLGRSAGVTVVRVGDEALVLGVTDQSVQLLARTDLSAVAPAAPAVPTVREPLELGLDLDAATAQAAAPLPAPSLVGAVLAGSALSPATWSRGLDVLRERTTRR